MLINAPDTFQNIVPHRSRDCQVLLRSIFALSARHLGQTHSDLSQRKKYNQMADTHNAACINIMKCLLTSKNYKSKWTEHLFAATIILQVMEEMNGTSAEEKKYQNQRLISPPQPPSATRPTATSTKPTRP